MAANQKSKYKEIYSLTEELYGNKNALPVQKGNYLTRWNDLSDYWVSLQNDDPMRVVMHKVHWGKYPQTAHLKTHARLYVLLEEELLNIHSPIHKAQKSSEHIWNCYRYFKTVTHADVSGGLGYHSGITKEFLLNKTSKKLGEGVLDLYVTPFQNVICKLIPVAEGWSEEQWSDDRNIFTAIEEKYGIDYTLYPEDFRKLYLLLNVKWNDGLMGTYNEIFRMEHLPWSLVQKIWPKNTEKFILNKYCAAKRHIYKKKKFPRYGKKIISDATLSKSWVMQYINDLPQNKEEKTMLFNAMLDIWDA